MEEKLVTKNTVEAISVDKDGGVLPISLEYNEYREDLINIYSTTTDDNCLRSEFIVNGDKCLHKLVISFPDGSHSIEKNKEFLFNEDFINNFLVPMLNDYNKYNEVFNDSIVLENSDSAIFIVNTKLNDLLVVKGIDEELANKLNNILPIKDSNIIDIAKIKKKINQRGVANIVIIVMTIILIAVALIGTIFFTIMSNK